jgi:hypothetical protein
MEVSLLDFKLSCMDSNKNSNNITVQKANGKE